jgi:hypothetical protein
MALAPFRLAGSIFSRLPTRAGGRRPLGDVRDRPGRFARDRLIQEPARLEPDAECSTIVRATDRPPSLIGRHGSLSPRTTTGLLKSTCDSASLRRPEPSLWGTLLRSVRLAGAQQQVSLPPTLLAAEAGDVSLCHEASAASLMSIRAQIGSEQRRRQRRGPRACPGPPSFERESRAIPPRGLCHPPCAWPSPSRPAWPRTWPCRSCRAALWAPRG